MNFKFINYNADKIKNIIKQKESLTRTYIVMNVILFLVGAVCAVAGVVNDHGLVVLIGGATAAIAGITISKKLDAFGKFISSFQCQYHFALEQQTLSEIEIDTSLNQLRLIIFAGDNRTTFNYNVNIVTKENITEPELDVENTILYIPGRMSPKK